MYAVFHRILEDVAAMLVPGLAALPEVQTHFYRAINHNDVANVCRLFVRQAQSPTGVRWEAPYSWLTGVPISADLKDVCEKFTELQKDRHEADYNPNGGYTKTQALLALNKAEVWLTKWDTVANDPAQTAALTAFLYLLGPDKVVAR